MADLKISQLTGATTPLAGTEVVPLVQSSTTKKVSVENLTAGREVTSKNLLELPRAGALPTNGSVVTGLTLFNDQDNATSDGVRILFDHSYRVPGSQTRGAYAYSFGETTFAGSVGLKFGVTDGGVFKDSLYLKGNTDVQVLTGNLVPATAAKGVNFTANTPAAGVTSQLLNWYEEGTWTPAFGAYSGAFTSLTYATQIGRYTRVGNQVTAYFSIVVSAVTTGTAATILLVTGLPFTPTYGTCVTTYQSNFSTQGPDIGQFYGAGSNLLLRSKTATSAANVAPSEVTNTTELTGFVTYYV